MSKVEIVVTNIGGGEFIIDYIDESTLRNTNFSTTQLNKALAELFKESGFIGKRGRRVGTKNKPKVAIAQSTD